VSRYLIVERVTRSWTVDAEPGLDIDHPDVQEALAEVRFAPEEEESTMTIEALDPQVWIATNDGYAILPVDQYIRSCMGGFMTGLYPKAIQEYGLDAVARDDWENFWMLGDNVLTSQGEAERYAEAEGYKHVVHVALSDVKRVLAEDYGGEE
jgi:hypothetical protein